MDDDGAEDEEGQGGEQGQEQDATEEASADAASAPAPAAETEKERQARIAKIGNTIRSENYNKHQGRTNKLTRKQKQRLR